ncbi:conserved hypothetical protein [Theileria orientalis strain Shintoku]|uniref:Uncharacterized protein n=1 Tax=Theileria orientalis strain Shintoku TaxID=869250 RepID=J4CC60_THEOR|nr:conserved hypothetical protein [Theileria orientalis strain Shintoku]BAM38827.1 conserved hypothetical protein [Theileria orientalis strain Shintoku]|eukprot:XP_009689128.1 conserved hypothetical protein [Theileria orientalis strain Shintoku]
MGDNIHKSYKKADSQYYQSSQEWQNYTQPEANYTQGGTNQERMQYSQYDHNYINYKSHQGQNSEPISYQNRQNETPYQQMYDSYQYASQSDQTPIMYQSEQQMGYSNKEMGYYNRDPHYYQARNTGMANYMKQEYNTQMMHGPSSGGKTHSTGTSVNPHTSPNVNTGMSPNNANMSFAQQMGYYGGNTPEGRPIPVYNEVKYNVMRPEAKQPGQIQPEMRYAAQGYSQNSQNDGMRYPGEDVRYNTNDIFAQQGYFTLDARHTQQGYGGNEGGYGLGDPRGTQMETGYMQHNYQDGRYIRDTRPDAPDIGYQRPYLPNASMFKPSLSFKEVATAMLSMESNRKQQQKKQTSRPKQNLKTVPKGSRQMSEGASPKNSEGSQMGSDASGRDAKLGKRNDNEEGFYFKTDLHSSIRTDPNYSKYKNRGLQQLSQYNALAQFHNLPTSYFNQYINQNMGNAANESASNAKDWMPIRKINPNILTPSARFFPPTPKALSTMRNEQAAHKINVVEEITVENEMLKNLKRSTISSASSMMESFQQSYSNKRKRIKNCLVEDCRHVIGEQPKIDIQFTCTDEAGTKKYALDEVLSTLLPYHLFYYDKVSRPETKSFDYSDFSKEIMELKERLNHLTKSKDSLLLQSVGEHRLYAFMCVYTHLSCVHRPLYLGFTRVPTRSFKSYSNTKLTSRAFDSGGNDARKSVTDFKREREEVRREAITHVYFRPTFAQKLLIMKTRFLATGWILVAFIIGTYLATKFTLWFSKWTHRDRYSL